MPPDGTGPPAPDDPFDGGSFDSDPFDGGPFDGAEPPPALSSIARLTGQELSIHELLDAVWLASRIPEGGHDARGAARAGAGAGGGGGPAPPPPPPPRAGARRRRGRAVGGRWWPARGRRAG